ncbi:hypothetical protein RFI_16201 [Reticulomyxa filosa]|uniref:Uncharacterized protein n=1 Tax=Reticulomyxa filosa TaxID=46433 RepID=X6N4Q5_RETFI|nr:hypothetical protein RFI_16201 [Reticulomyxa filosa]|eukprot:ETO21001.1 hypothetical protein RFI_16201 [Reticulomyxa filosa]
MILAAMWVVPYFAIHRLFYLLTFGLGYDDKVLIVLRICTFQLFTVFPGNVHSLRMWKIHYDFKLVQLTSNEKWKRIIMSNGNPAVTNNKSSHFYLRHQNTIGNLKWLFNFIIILSVIEGTLSGFVSICISLFGFLTETVNHFQTLFFLPSTMYLMLSFGKLHLLLMIAFLSKFCTFFFFLRIR